MNAAPKYWLRDLAEIAVEADGIVAFRQSALERLVEFAGADAASYCSMRPGMNLDAAQVGAVTSIELFRQYIRDITAGELQRALAPKTHEDGDLIPAGRRDRLSVYREFLYPNSIRRYAIRAWRDDAGQYCWVTLARTGHCDWRGFMSRAAAVLDGALPLVVLGERAHRRSAEEKSRVPEIATTFTPAEARVVDLLQRGLTNREIAAVLGLSPNTVRNRVASAFARVGATRRAELVYLLRGGSG